VARRAGGAGGEDRLDDGHRSTGGSGPRIGHGDAGDGGEGGLDGLLGPSLHVGAAARSRPVVGPSGGVGRGRRDHGRRPYPGPSALPSARAVHPAEHGLEHDGPGAGPVDDGWLSPPTRAREPPMTVPQTDDELIIDDAEE